MASLASYEQDSKPVVDRISAKSRPITKELSLIDLTDDSPPPSPSQSQAPALDQKLDKKLVKKPLLSTAAEQLAEIRVMHKRKAEAEGRSEGGKRFSLDVDNSGEGSTSGTRFMGIPVSGSFSGKREPGSQAFGSGRKGGSTNGSAARGGMVAPEPIAIKYAKGALRLSQVPGRAAVNTIHLSDILVRESLLAVWIHSFFIEPAALYPCLNLDLRHHKDFAAYRSPHEKRRVPTYIGRDMKLDDPEFCEMAAARAQSDIDPTKTLNIAQHQEMSQILAQMYQESFGLNYIALYPKASGSVHSKVAIAKYEGFIRIMITSANMMTVDTELCSNHFFVVDVPLLQPGQPHLDTDFESRLIAHAKSLLCPSAFLDDLVGRYDFSSIPVDLITSEPGSYHGDKLYEHGLPRLGHLCARELEGNSRDLGVEICTASIGVCKPLWLRQYWHLVAGGTADDLPKKDKQEDGIPPFKIVFPTKTAFKECDEEAQKCAGNIMSALKWRDAPPEVRSLFHEYIDKARGRLFHQKLVILLHAARPRATPYAIYIGSANFSESAWGSFDWNLKSGLPRLKINNSEIGVFIKGKDIEALLEAGEWEDGMTYVRPAKPYVVTGPVGRRDQPFRSG